MGTRKVKNLEAGDVIVLAGCNYKVDSVWEGVRSWCVRAWCGHYVLEFSTYADALVEVE